MDQSFRLPDVGLINRNNKLSFKFNGKIYYGYEGDTLASALIANGIHLIGRSFKYFVSCSVSFYFNPLSAS